MKKLLIFMLLLCSLSTTAFAYDEELFQKQLDIVGGNNITSAIPGENRGYMENISPSPNQDLGQSFAAIYKKTAGERSGAVRSAVSTLIKVAIVLIFCGCASGIRGTSGSVISSNVITMAGALGITTAVFSDIHGLLALCLETIDHINIFSKAMLPVMAASITIAGAPTAATVSYSITMFAFDILITFTSGVLVPAVCAYIAIVTVNAAMGNDTLSRLAGFVKWVTSGTLKLFLTVFIAYITVSSSVSHGLDGMAVKTAKFALSGTVPVVGSIISDATDTLLSGAVVLKNSLGVFGMIGVCAICIVPFLKVGISYLIFKAGSAVLSPICNENLGKLVSGIGDSIGMILGMLGTCTAVIFFELVFSVAMVKTI